MTRFFDIIFSSIAIVILFPFMLPIMIGLKLTGEHDIFYKQTRIGRGGKNFQILKFATMLRNSPNLNGGLYTSENDTRILPMGKFLRKTKFNELPQLINIFVGQMSIIGYRPTVRQHYEAYNIDFKMKSKDVSPGLSGIGSIVFRDEEVILQKCGQNKDYFHQKVIIPYKSQLECWYMDHQSIGNYFKLIYMTVVSVIHPANCKWRTAFKGLPPVPSELENFI